MDWRLFDIRIGRANRAQFMTSVMLYFSLAFLTLGIKDHTIQLSALLPATYILGLMLMRRLRDLGIQTSTSIQWLAFILLLISLLPATQMIVFFLGFKDYDLLIMAYSSYIFLMPLSIIGLALIFIFVPILFICEGWSTDNEYGPKPTGFDFRTMITPTKNSNTKE